MNSGKTRRVLRCEPGHRSINCPERKVKDVITRVRVSPDCLRKRKPVYLDRDLNGASNILEVFTYFAETGQRPDWNLRQ